MKQIGYVLADFPVFSETFVGDEMRAVVHFGHRIVPIVMHLRQGPAQTADRALAKDARTLDSTTKRQALSTLARPSRGAAAALRYVWRQRRLPRLSLLWNAMKIAAIARSTGCEHLHAHFSGGAAAHAIVAARWIGASVSFVCHGHDVYAEPEDLLSSSQRRTLSSRSATTWPSTLIRSRLGRALRQFPAALTLTPFGPLAEALPTAASFLSVGWSSKRASTIFSTALSIQGSASVDLVGDGPLADECEPAPKRWALATARVLSARARANGSLTRRRYQALIAPFKPRRRLARLWTDGRQGSDGDGTTCRRHALHGAEGDGDRRNRLPRRTRRSRLARRGDRSAVNVTRGSGEHGPQSPPAHDRRLFADVASRALSSVFEAADDARTVGQTRSILAVRRSVLVTKGMSPHRDTTGDGPAGPSDPGQLELVSSIVEAWHRR